MSYITVGQENSANIDIYYEDLGAGQPIVLIQRMSEANKYKYYFFKPEPVFATQPTKIFTSWMAG